MMPKTHCRLCDERIWSYVHSQAGPIKACAWTTIGPDSEDDPRYGTQCQYGGTLNAFRHEPELPEDDALEDDEEWI